MNTNKQPIEKIHFPMLENNPDDDLDVVDIFWTIQGEGPFAGRPAVFVRLAGCNLQCPACDTDYTTGRRMKKVDEIILHIGIANGVNSVNRRGWGNLVVITGGEPFRQPIQTLCYQLLKSTDYEIQIETNGTIFKNMHRRYKDDIGRDMVWDSQRMTVVVSPKVGAINVGFKDICKHLKYVVSADNIDTIDGLPHSTLGNSVRVARPWPEFSGTIYLQPLDEQDEEKNRKNMEAAVRACMRHGYTLCTQMHKALNLP